MTKPIQDDTQGHWSVVATWQIHPSTVVTSVEEYRDALESFLRKQLRRYGGFPIGLTVHVRVVGAGGGAGEDEGRWDAPRHHTTRDKEDIDPGDKL